MRFTHGPKSFEICNHCFLKMYEGEEKLWCKVQGCPHTPQREATPEQRQEFKMDEEFNYFEEAA